MISPSRGLGHTPGGEQMVHSSMTGHGAIPASIILMCCTRPLVMMMVFSILTTLSLEDSDGCVLRAVMS